MSARPAFLIRKPLRPIDAELVDAIEALVLERTAGAPDALALAACHAATARVAVHAKRKETPPCAER